MKWTKEEKKENKGKEKKAKGKERPGKKKDREINYEWSQEEVEGKWRR